MRICLYTSTALPLLGGQELVVDALARHFIALGHPTVVLAPSPSSATRKHDASLPYPMHRHPRFISTRRFVTWYRGWLLRVLRRHQVDVLHCHAAYPSGYVAASSRSRLRCPLVVTSHGEDVPGGGHRLNNPLIRQRITATFRAADALVAISQFTKDGYHQLCDPETPRIETISNGVETDELAVPVHRPCELDLAIEPGKYFLFLGRLHQRKGCDVLLEALAQCPSRGGVDLVVAGDGDELSALQRQAYRLGIAPRIRFLGAVRGQLKSYLLQNARCLVMPSRGTEGLPLVALEAFAAGRPIIASEVPGIIDLVQPRSTGWLVPPGCAASLAGVLQQVLCDPRPLAAMSERALSVATQRSWRSVAKQHVSLYEQLLNAPRVTRAA